MPTDTLGLAVANPVPRKRRLPGDRRRWAAGASVLALALLWWAATRFGWVDVLFLPAPEQLFEALQRLWQEGYLDASLLQHVGTSLLRVLLALGAAVLTAIPLGVLMGLNPLAGAALDPLVEFYRPIPPLAYLPLIVIWFGIGELSKVLLIYLALFAPLLIATAAGVRRVDRSRVQAVRCLGASRWQVVRYVILPSALPEVLTGLRIALGVGWSTLVAAELIAANRGLGFMVQSAAQFLATDVVVVGILLIAAIALAFELGLRWVQRRFAARFGDLHIHPIYPSVPEQPEVIVLDTAVTDVRDNAIWHTDVTFLETPALGAVLAAKQLPPYGGDTLWASSTAAYEALSAPLRRLLDGLTATHDIGKSFPRERFGVTEADLARLEEARLKNPPRSHPVVRTHPVTGRKCLFVSDGFTTRINELEPAESDALLKFLFAHATRPEFTVRWRWQENDVAFWDNRVTQHYAVDDYRPQRRVMHRATILGDKPF